MQNIIYNTGSGNSYPIEVNWSIVPYETIAYEPEAVEQLCKKGCKNYGKSGGCPPYAPKFEQFYENNKKYILLTGKFYSKYKTDKVKACKNRAIHWKFQDVVLARFSDRVGRALSHDLQGEFFSTGYCMGCPGKKCAIKLNEACRNPERRTFSMEATGINVVKTVKRNFGEDFFWYSKENFDVPYMMKAILLTSFKPSHEIEIIINSYLNNFAVSGGL